MKIRSGVAEDGVTGVFNIYFLRTTDKPTDKPQMLLQSPHSMRYLSWSPRTSLNLEAQRIKAEREGNPRKIELSIQEKIPPNEAATNSDLPEDSSPATN